ncbi:hypothetical protein ON010_g10847 [Phytophthora cinnamomi]|nr:hypothetical protein ON010_g10847 [Phytophthora cinnamomi]
MFPTETTMLRTRVAPFQRTFFATLISSIQGAVKVSSTLDVDDEPLVHNVVAAALVLARAATLLLLLTQLGHALLRGSTTTRTEAGAACGDHGSLDQRRLAGTSDRDIKDKGLRSKLGLMDASPTLARLAPASPENVVSQIRRDRVKPPSLRFASELALRYARPARWQDGYSRSGFPRGLALTCAQSSLGWSDKHQTALSQILRAYATSCLTACSLDGIGLVSAVVSGQNGGASRLQTDLNEMDPSLGGSRVLAQDSWVARVLSVLALL